MSILAILSAVLVGYAQESGRQTIVMITQERILRLFARAKSISISTYVDNASQQSQGQSKICGYGLHVDSDPNSPSYGFFIFQSIAQDCTARKDFSYNPNSDKLQPSSLDVYKLDSSRVKFVQNSTLKDVIFIPPNPDIYINGDKSVTEAVVDLQLTDGSGAGATISINSDGQLNWSQKL